MTWTIPTQHPVDGPLTGPDRPMLEGFLAWERASLLNICAGLSAEQLALRPIATSELSLLGLIRHLAKVERIWLRQRVARQSIEPMYDPARGKDADFQDVEPSLAGDDLQRLQQEWQLADAAVADIDFEATCEVHGQNHSLRLVYVHLIGEYARHNGHADLLREAIDGVTGR